MDFESDGSTVELAHPRRERKLLYFLAGITAAGIMLLMVYLAARRFAKKQRELGRWDDYGPLEETEPPPEWGGLGRARSMWERLEVVGKWKGKVVRRRRPNEKP
jgi:hypothetical protein